MGNFFSRRERDRQLWNEILSLNNLLERTAQTQKEIVEELDSIKNSIESNINSAESRLDKLEEKLHEIGNALNGSFVE